MWREVNFDGIVGPTHNYAGLSYGNVASARHKGSSARPMEGVLQGFGKMRRLMELGALQGVLPPHERPYLPTLRKLGFTGRDEDILAAAWRASPELVANLASGAAMWTANAATITPAPDTADGRTHFTPANLAAMFHRSIEAEASARILQAIFPEGERFAHHAALPGGIHFGDEGAANHNRFASEHGAPGAALYVYGRRAFAGQQDLSFPGRQTREASEAVARQHQTSNEHTVFVRQNPEAINAGAFHNDVVAVANRHCFFYHEKAFIDPLTLQRALRDAGPEIDFHFIEVPERAVSLHAAIGTYIFNSQLVDLPGRNGMTLILPSEAKDHEQTGDYLSTLVADDPVIRHLEFLDVRQSMQNGGGPACLRLRIVLSEADRASLGGRVLLDEARLSALEDWARAHYRDRLDPADLGDAALWRESLTALDALTSLLDLGSIYAFQRAGG